MRSDHQYPLPVKQYRRYVIFWSALMLGALAVALGLVVWQALVAPGWREIAAAGLLLVQMGLYGGVLLGGRAARPSLRQLVLYFVICLAIWAAECWLVPEVWWIAFAYIGQMFGMLPVRIALLLTVAASILIFGNNLGWSIEQVDLSLVLAMAGQWGSIVVLLVYVSHLIRTSQERGRLIAELEAARQELEAAQGREAELAVLRERERLARDLHDSLGHALVALAVQLEAIQRLYRVDPERASAQVDELKALTRASMDALRRSVAGLRAPGLGDSALRPALQALCVEFGQRTGVAVTCQVDQGADGLRPALAEALWRVAQEALTNVERHAQARQVQVSLKCEAGSVALRIADDGVGLPPDAESMPNRFGLRGMRERVEGLGGTLSLHGGEGGTAVEARLPVIGGEGGEARDGGEGGEGRDGGDGADPRVDR